MREKQKLEPLSKMLHVYGLVLTSMVRNKEAINLVKPATMPTIVEPRLEILWSLVKTLWVDKSVTENSCSLLAMGERAEWVDMTIGGIWMVWSETAK